MKIFRLFFILEILYGCGYVMAQPENILAITHSTDTNKVNYTKDTIAYVKEIKSDSMAIQFNSDTVNVHIVDELVHEAQDKIYGNILKDSVFISFSHFDKIITLNREVIIARVERITPTDIFYVYPLNYVNLSINRSLISQILYADKSLEVFVPLDRKMNMPILQTERVIVRNKKDWEKVISTYNKEEVTDLESRGNVLAEFEAPKLKVDNEYLEKNAIIILKRKAANLGAHYVLITNTTFHSGYGDLPLVEMEGVAYGYPEDDE